MDANLKCVVFLGDGMSDEPMDELDGKTPLMVANTPNLDRLVREGVGGWSLNTPDGYYPGSDIANLGVLGYDVTTSYSGRSPLEAAAMDVDLGPNDVAFRCNLVHLSDDFSIMGDFSAGHISSEEAAELIGMINRELGTESFEFTAGVSYRHLLVWRNGRDNLTATPPHDISDDPIEGNMPVGPDAAPILDLMQRSWNLLEDHPVNKKRAERGEATANSIWLWGHGKRPKLQLFKERFGKSGAMITAVDLMRGIAKNIGFEMLEVDGATGWIDTNYEGKAEACIDGLKRHDFVFVHLESPDEAGHAGRTDYKIQAIEDLDAKIIGPVMKYLEEDHNGLFRVVSLPDHPTPISIKTHTSDPVPLALFGTDVPSDDNQTYDEKLLKNASLTFKPGRLMMKALLADKWDPSKLTD